MPQHFKNRENPSNPAKLTQEPVQVTLSAQTPLEKLGFVSYTSGKTVFQEQDGV